MKLTRKIFHFTPLKEGDVLTTHRITNSLLVIDNVVSSISTSLLFKGSVKKNSDSSISGFSILEFLNDKGEIEIEKRIRNFSFQTTSENEPVFIFRLEKKQDEESMFDYELSEQEHKEMDALLTEAILKADEENNKKKDEAVVVFEPVKECELYTADKNDLLRQGFKEYTFENYRLLKKGTKEVLCFLEENKYTVVKKKDKTPLIDTENSTFIFE